MENISEKMEERELYKKIKKNWDSVAKPLDSMGKFENYIARIGTILNNERPELGKCAVVVFGADNGIVAEGVSQSGQEVTTLCMENFTKMQTSVCVMAKANDIDIIPVDIGVNSDLENIPEDSILVRKKVRMGTRNFHIEPALTNEEVKNAMEVGMEMAYYCKEEGYEMIGIGEIGIGNTTTTSAIAASLLKCSAKEVTGRGAGLEDEGLKRKTAVIDEAIERYDLHNAAPMEILRCVGGLDIAGMAGLYIGAAKCGLPVILDGVISIVTALLTERYMPGVKEYMIPSHMSKEPAAVKIAGELNMSPVIDAEMALGEGTGAVMMISLLKTAYEVYKNGCLFEDTKIEQYERF